MKVIVTFLVAAFLASVGVTIAAMSSNSREKTATTLTVLTPPALPPATSSTPTPAPKSPVFEDRWAQELLERQQLEKQMLEKQDKLQMAPVLAGPLPLKTERILVKPGDSVESAVPKTKPPSYKNVCEKHNMRKVKTGKYGWRCRK